MWEKVTNSIYSQNHVKRYYILHSVVKKAKTEPHSLQKNLELLLPRHNMSNMVQGWLKVLFFNYNQLSLDQRRQVLWLTEATSQVHHQYPSPEERVEKMKLFLDLNSQMTATVAELFHGTLLLSSSTGSDSDWDDLLRDTMSLLKTTVKSVEIQGLGGTPNDQQRSSENWGCSDTTSITKKLNYNSSFVDQRTGESGISRVTNYE